MKKTILKITALNLLAMAIVVMPSLSRAQDITSTNTAGRIGTNDQRARQA